MPFINRLIREVTGILDRVPCLINSDYPPPPRPIVYTHNLIHDQDEVVPLCGDHEHDWAVELHGPDVPVHNHHTPPRPTPGEIHAPFGDAPTEIFTPLLGLLQVKYTHLSWDCSRWNMHYTHPSWYCSRWNIHTPLGTAQGAIYTPLLGLLKVKYTPPLWISSGEIHTFLFGLLQVKYLIYTPLLDMLQRWNMNTILISIVSVKYTLYIPLLAMVQVKYTHSTFFICSRSHIDTSCIHSPGVICTPLLGILQVKYAHPPKVCSKRK